MFFDELIRTHRRGKSDAARVLGLLATYHRDDLKRALERAVRYRAYSWSAVERILAAQARPRSVWESLEAEAQEQLDAIFRQSPLSVRSTAEYQPLLEETARASGTRLSSERGFGCAFKGLWRERIMFGVKITRKQRESISVGGPMPAKLEGGATSVKNS